MDADPDGRSEDLPPPRRRARLLARVENDAPMAADLLARGYRELDAKQGTTWQCMVGHAFREAMNRLPGELVESSRGRRERVAYAELVEAVAAHYPLQTPDRWEPSTEASAAVDDLVAEHRALAGRLTARAEELIVTLRRGAVLPSGDVRARALIWRRIQSTFSEIAHLREEGEPLPSADKVERAVEDFELLFGALEADPFYELSDELEALARLESPTRDDRTRVLSLMASSELTAAFLAAATPGWLSELRAAGMFLEPHDAVEGLLPRWPQSEYLARIASDSPREVADAVEALPPTDNARVYADVLTAALQMPAPEAIRVARHATRWLQAGQCDALLDSLWSRLVEHLLSLGEPEEALRVARTLLVIDVVDKRDREAPMSSLARCGMVPRALGEWGFQSFLHDQVPLVAEAKPLETLEALTDQLRWALTRETELAGGEDAVWFDIDRPAIEPHEQNTPLDKIRDAYIDAVRDCALQVAVASPECAAAAIDMLDGHVVLRRIRMHVLRELALPKFADRERALLLDASNFDNSAVHHEYWLLLGARFESLDADAKQLILARIDRGPQPIGEEGQTPERTASIEHWQRDRLSMIRQGLPTEWAERLRELEARRGCADHPAFLHYMTTFNGPTSPLGDQELASLGDDALIRYLNEWEEGDGIEAPSSEGLGRVLARATAADPARFSRLAPRFADLDDRYAAALFTGLNEAGDDQHAVHWPPLLDFAAQKLAGSPAQGTRQTLAWLLGTALRLRSIPIELRGKVWPLLERLARDPDPSAERERERDGTMRGGNWNMLMLNSVRAVAIGAVWDYAAWVVVAAGAAAASPGEVPEARAVLAHAADPAREPSLAVAGVLGERWPHMLAFDRDWAIRQRDQLFRSGRQERRTAAFDAYLRRSRLYTSVVELLQEEYRTAVDRLLCDEAADSPLRRRLIDQVMTLHWTGRDDLAEPLVERLFARAPAEVRAQAIRQSAQGLRHTPASEQPLERIAAFWEWRLRTLRHGDPEAAELCGWFAVAALDATRSFELLLRTMDMSDDGVANLPGVLERALGLVPAAPEGALELTRRAIEQQGRRLWSIRDELRALLQALIAAGGTIRERAIALVHRLGDQGVHFARDLLPSASSGP